MRSVDLGFDPRNVLEVTVDLPQSRYATTDVMREFDARVLENLGAIPGVEAAGAINFLPLSKTSISGGFTLEDGRKLPTGYNVGALSVSPDYFRAMGMHIEHGRGFTADDRTNGARVVILGHSVAEKFWPGGNAVGKRISSSNNPTAADWVTIVGVVNDVVQGAVTSRPSRSAYSPIAQTDPPFFLRHVTFVLRSRDEAALTPIEVATARVLHEADPNLATQTATPMPELIDRTTAAPRFQSRMLLTFSLTALVLAMIGVYGVLSYNLAQRQQEIGVRIALGATPGEIARMVLRGTTMLVVPGIIVGLAASFALTRVLGRFLFQITATDPTTFASVVVVLTIVALAAAALPARRASRIDPTILTRAGG
jgi:putative ABC transport system permease protein